MRRLNWVIPIANELGYFPTEKQATEINCRAATLYAAHFGGRPPRGRVDDAIHDKTLQEAIEAIMSEAAKVRVRKPGRPKKR
jgi:hypothetical protein